MRTRLLFAGMLAVAVVVGVALAWWRWPGGTGTVSAQEVAQRAEVARSTLAAGLGPDSTLHVVQLSFSASRPAPGPWVSPTHERNEWWAYFGSDGNLAAIRTNSTDAETGVLVGTTELVDGSLVYTDVASGEVRSERLNATATEIRDRITGAQSETGQLVSGAAAARSSTTDGRQTFVVDRAAGGFTTRSYIDATDFREVRWERIDAAGTITESEDTPVFEVIAGKSP